MRFQNLILTALMSTLVVCIDQISKFIIVEIIMQPPHLVRVFPFLNFDLSYNTEMSFGLFASQFQSSPMLLIVITSTIAISVLMWGGFFSLSRTEAMSAGLVAGGAIGNIIDRSMRGLVTDFLDLHIAGLSWPTFNLADTAIVMGAIVLVSAQFKSLSVQEQKTND